MFQRENLDEIMSRFEGTPRRFWDIKLCHMGSELDINFSKLSDYLG